MSGIDRCQFIGGSDARTIMGDDQGALVRLWREKRGEIEPEEFLNADRHVGTMLRIRSHTTQISPLLSKNSSSSIIPRFTMLATISQ